jgi:hypothetical protein
MNNNRGFGTYSAGGSGGLAAHFERFGAVEQFPAFAGSTSFFMDVENNIGVTQSVPVPQIFLEQLITAIAQYMQVVYPELEQGTNPDNISSMLTKTAVEFFQSEPFLQDFAGFFTSTAQSSGVVPFNKVSAWDVLKGSVPSFLMGFIEDGFMLTPRDGCRAIYNNMTQLLQSAPHRLFLNATVTKVIRPHASSNSHGKITVHFKVNGGAEQHLIGDELVMAIPPTLENMEKIGMTLQSEEHAVFQHMRVSPGYFGVEFESAEVTPVLTNSNTQNLFGEANFDITPVPIILCEFINASGNQGPCHGFAVSTHKTNVTEMTERVIHQTELMDLLPNSVNFTLTSIVEHEGYFAHIEQQALENDPTLYGKLNALQGLFDTYWIGAGSSYADRTLAIEHANSIAQAHFGSVVMRRDLSEGETGTINNMALENAVKFVNRLGRSRFG